MIESVLRHYLESPWRVWIVIFLTLGLGLVVILPSADEYTALHDRRVKLTTELAEIRSDAGRVDRLEKEAIGKQTILAELEARAVPQDKVNLFRGRVVELAREAGCQIRRVNVGEVRQRDWQKGSSPLDLTVSGSGKSEGGFLLKAQSLTLTVSGKLTNTRDFLTRLMALNLLLHVKHFSLRPEDGEGTEVAMELDVELFDLTEAVQPSRTPAAG